MTDFEKLVFEKCAENRTRRHFASLVLEKCAESRMRKEACKKAVLAKYAMQKRALNLGALGKVLTLAGRAAKAGGKAVVHAPVGAVKAVGRGLSAAGNGVARGVKAVAMAPVNFAADVGRGVAATGKGIYDGGKYVLNLPVRGVKAMHNRVVHPAAERLRSARLAAGSKLRRFGGDLTGKNVRATEAARNAHFEGITKADNMVSQMQDTLNHGRQEYVNLGKQLQNMKGVSPEVAAQRSGVQKAMGQVKDFNRESSEALQRAQAQRRALESQSAVVNNNYDQAVRNMYRARALAVGAPTALYGGAIGTDAVLRHTTDL